MAKYHPFESQRLRRYQASHVEATPAEAAEEKAAGKALARGATLAMVVLCTAVFVAALDQTMVLTVIPDIMRSLFIDVRNLNDVGWIITAYLLGYTVAMPLFGRLADVWGRRPTTMVALALFMVGSAFCVVLSRLDLFVAARVVQAAGGGALVPIAMSAGADMFPLKRRGLVLGIIGGAAEAGGVLGPLYGAGLAAAWDWRLIFLVNVPLCLLLMPVCWRLLRPGAAPSYQSLEVEAGPEPAVRSARRWWQRGRVDYLGAALMALSLAGITIGLGTGTQAVGESTQAGSPVRWPWLVVAVLAFVTFILYERRIDQPLIRLDLFRKAPFTAANIAHFLVGAALIIGMVEIPLYANTLFGLDRLGSGLLLIQLTAMIPVGAVVGGLLADYIGYRATAILGFLVACGGYLLVSRWPLEPSSLRMMRDLFIAGFGFGLVVGPIGATVTRASGSRWLATGSALVTVSRMVGMVIGLSVLSSWAVRRFNTLSAGIDITIVRPAGLSDAEWEAMKQASEAALDKALQTVFSEFFLIAAIIIALAVIPALFFYNKRVRGESKLPFFPA
jgi:MFS family permease